MANQSLAATTACPPTPAPAAALPSAAPPASPLKESPVAVLVSIPTPSEQQEFEALWAKRIAAPAFAVLDALAATEKAPRAAAPASTPAATPALTLRQRLDASLPMNETRYRRVEGNKLAGDEKGAIISRAPVAAPWVTFTPAAAIYSVDRYIDREGRAALARKMGAEVEFAAPAHTALAALSAAARRTEAQRLDAQRAKRAAAYARWEAERQLCLEEQRAADRAARAKAKAKANADRKAQRLEAQRLKDEAKAKARADRKAQRLEAKADRKGAQPLSAAARRLLAALRALGGRLVPYAQSRLARAQGGVGMAATVKALAKVARWWGRAKQLDGYDLDVIECDFTRAYTIVLPICERAAVRASRPLNKDKGVPQALTLALTLARKVRG